MTQIQQIITVTLVVAATVTTRFLPYILFPEEKRCHRLLPTSVKS